MSYVPKKGNVSVGILWILSENATECHRMLIRKKANTICFMSGLALC